jgi:CheY-like chemotaxis protein
VTGDGAARDRASAAARVDTGGRSVLIVDDDPFIRKLVATTLEDVAGFDLVEASDGVEAVEIARIHSPAIIFLDVNMPRLDGIGAAAQLRALPGAEATTIVMLTAAGPERERAARDAGADLFLTKPFSPLDLLRLVDEIGGAG